MKVTGIVRKVDSLGRIVLPIELRKTLNIKGADHGEGTPLEIYVDGGDIILKKYNNGCHCCGEVNGLTEVLGIKICPSCLKQLKEAAELIDKVRK